MESIKVSLRVRPLNDRELRYGERSAWEVLDWHDIRVVSENIISTQSRQTLQNAVSANKQLRFSYDRCFDETASNKYVYETSVQSILKSSLNGVNGTIFMYGQSGSGKTYTMMGYERRHLPSTSPTASTAAAAASSRRRSSFGSHHHHPQQQQSLQPRSQNISQNIEVDDIDFEQIQSNTPEDKQGILLLALQDLFETISMDLDKTYVVQCSYVEIYNDQIFDLLNPTAKLSEVLQVGMNAAKEFYIKNLTQRSVSCLDEAYAVLKIGETNKHYAQTTMNHNSSRSHSIFKLFVQSISSQLLKTSFPRRMGSANVNNEEMLGKLQQHDATLISTSELNFIDLAGSERVSNHANLEELLGGGGGGGGIATNAGEQQRSPTMSNRSEGLQIRDISPQEIIKDRVKEGQYINKSLFFLTQVISQIAEGKPLAHIPYRNSPLTKILKSSLGGNSRTNIILCITPTQSQFDQSYSTVRFGLNAKKIENKVRVNIQTKNNEEAMQLFIQDYEKKIRSLEQAKNEEMARSAALSKRVQQSKSEIIILQQRLAEHEKKGAELAKFAEASLSLSARREARNVASAAAAAALICENCNKPNYFQPQQQLASSRLPSRRQPAPPPPCLIKKPIMQEKALHCDFVGVLFANNENNVEVDDIELLCSSQLPRNWQQLIFDSQGKYAMQMYRHRNKQLAENLQLWKQIDENIEKVSQEYLALLRTAKDNHQQMTTTTTSFSRAEPSKSNTCTAEKETIIDLHSLSESCLSRLERCFQLATASVISEQYKRRLLAAPEFSSAISFTSNLLNNSVRLILPTSQPPLPHQDYRMNQSEKEGRERIHQLFYSNVDVKTLLKKHDFNLAEFDCQPDFASLLAAITQKSSQQNTNATQANPQQQFIDQTKRVSHPSKQRTLSCVSGTTDMLKYHQNPMPREHEEQILQNYEKLQNQSLYETAPASGFPPSSNHSIDHSCILPFSLSQHPQQQQQHLFDGNYSMLSTPAGEFNSTQFLTSLKQQPQQPTFSSNILTTFTPNTAVVTRFNNLPAASMRPQSPPVHTSICHPQQQQILKTFPRESFQGYPQLQEKPTAASSLKHPNTLVPPLTLPVQAAYPSNVIPSSDYAAPSTYKVLEKTRSTSDYLGPTNQPQSVHQQRLHSSDHFAIQGIKAVVVPPYFTFSSPLQQQQQSLSTQLHPQLFNNQAAVATGSSISVSSNRTLPLQSSNINYLPPPPPSSNPRKKQLIQLNDMISIDFTTFPTSKQKTATLSNSNQNNLPLQASFLPVTHTPSSIDPRVTTTLGYLPYDQGLVQPLPSSSSSVNPSRTASPVSISPCSLTPAASFNNSRISPSRQIKRSFMNN